MKNKTQKSEGKMLKEMLEKYEPYDEQKQRDKEVILRH